MLAVCCVNTGLQFPWLPKLLLSVDEAAGLQLDTSPCLILLLDGADGCVPCRCALLRKLVLRNAHPWCELTVLSGRRP